MLAAYGVDVLDPSVSLRRVAVLLRHLPPHARRHGESWSVEAELLATLVDRVGELSWITAKAGGAKHARRPKPLRRPPPGPLLARDAPRVNALPAGPGRPPGKGTKMPSWPEAIRQLAGQMGAAE